MRHSIIVALVAALATAFVPQAALAATKSAGPKPPVTAHPDIAPEPDLTASAPVPATSGFTAQSAAISSGGASGGTNSMSFSSLTTGDIVVVLDPASITGHAGLFDRNRYSSILSYAMLSANVTPISGVQVEKCAKYRLYDRAWGLRVPQEYAHRGSVRDFAARQLGKPYSVAASKSDLSSFYCSKLAWAAYRYVTGVDLDADGGTWVWPVDLVNSRYTSIVGYWS